MVTQRITTNGHPAKFFTFTIAGDSDTSRTWALGLVSRSGSTNPDSHTIPLFSVQQDYSCGDYDPELNQITISGYQNSILVQELKREFAGEIHQRDQLFIAEHTAFEENTLIKVKVCTTEQEVYDYTLETIMAQVERDREADDEEYPMPNFPNLGGLNEARLVFRAYLNLEKFGVVKPHLRFNFKTQEIVIPIH